MKRSEKELEARLNVLPDSYPDFVRLAMLSIRERGLVCEVLEMLDETEDATTDTVLEFESIYCGDLELYDDCARIPVDVDRLTLTSGMRDHLAELKGKTFKSYQFAPIGGSEGKVADCNVRINMGQHAVDLNCYNFAFNIAGRAVELGAWHCERMSLLDDFRPWAETPFHAYAVNERITGVELVTDRVTVEAGDGAQELDIDVAVALRTAHAVYTFARESWRSTNLVVAAADDIATPYSEGECDGSWLFGTKKKGIGVKATRSTTRLA